MREFQGEKAHRPKKDFACRMCAGPPTSEMPKSIFCVQQPSVVPSAGGVLVVSGCVSVVSVVVM